MVIGSEGILGVITEAWMRIQRRPTFRATAGIVFPTWAAGTDAVRQIVQAKLWPANCRILDPAEAARAAGLDGTASLVIVSFESADHSQRHADRRRGRHRRAAGGRIADDDVKVDDGRGEPTGRGGSVGAWRDAFIGVDAGVDTSLGLVADTFETAITWDRWPEFDADVRQRVSARALGEVFGRDRRAVVPLHARLPGRPGAVLHVDRDGPPGLGADAVGRDQGGGQRGRRSTPAARSPTTTPSAGCTARSTTASAPSCSRPRCGPPSTPSTRPACMNPGVLIDP